MIFSQDLPNQDVTFESIMRTKREKYVVDLRKKKKLEILNMKRIKVNSDIDKENKPAFNQYNEKYQVKSKNSKNEKYINLKYMYRR